MVVIVGSSPKCIETLGSMIPCPALGCVQSKAAHSAALPPSNSALCQPSDELCKPIVLSNELSVEPSFQDQTLILSSNWSS